MFARIIALLSFAEQSLCFGENCGYYDELLVRNCVPYSVVSGICLSFILIDFFILRFCSGHGEIGSVCL